MPLYSIDPIQDARWEEMVLSNPNSSVFHRKGWLKSLADTYGYIPVALTSSRPEERLSDGVAFCLVNSWLTGKRLVSLPFSDYVDPLLDSSYNAELADWMRNEIVRQHLRYVEYRSLSWRGPSDIMAPFRSFWLHSLDLTKSVDDLFANLHKSCLQRRIRKAEREYLEYDRGCSDRVLEDLFSLLLVTRRRHRLLPQPRSWFHNLATNMRPDFEIRVARKDGRAIAAIVTIRHGNQAVYKYGCSDDSYHHLGAMPFLFWKVIVESKAEGASILDFGRTELNNEGLVRFKDQFGTSRRKVEYYRYPIKNSAADVDPSRVPFAEKLISAVPDYLSWKLGEVLYRHMG